MASRVAVEEVSIGIESFQVTKILLKTQRAEQDLGTIQYRRTGKREINLIREERQTIQYRNRRRLESSSTSQQHAEGSSRMVIFRDVHFSSDIPTHSSQQHMQHPYQRINQRHGQQVLNWPPDASGPSNGKHTSPFSDLVIIEQPDSSREKTFHTIAAQQSCGHGQKDKTEKIIY